jgi:hypothetical protein
MLWTEIREAHPHQWLIIEALEAYTTPNQQRELTQIGIIAQCADGQEAQQRYRQLHTQYPLREFYFVHTSRETLDIRERPWVGIRRHDAVSVGG